MRRQFFVFGWLVLSTAGTVAAADKIQFNRDIRSILSDACFACHGPDEKSRQADLRLDVAESALATREGRRAIVPGDLGASELIRRVTSRDPDVQMPPPDSGHRITPAQVDLLRKWIAEGAKWEKHWSLLPPVRPDLPLTNQQGPFNQPLDAFVLARLPQEKLQQSPAADQPTLLRRATFDLTGLPPTLAELKEFASSEAPDAYEQALDRLLASPRYGERMAGPWLDAARYADTSGYQSDGERHMWRWRDWVIEAYNRGMPFDQFTIEQLAGDLLPVPEFPEFDTPEITLNRKIATGFHRNHRGNAEGGIIPEEYAAEYVADRVETTGTVWLGLTIGCARCHDHKFDPVSTKEFYQLAAFFNNVPEKGRAVKVGNSPPFIPAPTKQQLEKLHRLEGQSLSAALRWSEQVAKLTKEMVAWEATAPANLPDHFTPDAALVKQWHLDEPQFDGSRVIEGGDIADFGYFDKFTLSAWIYLEDEQSCGTIISRMTDVPEGDGYQLAIAHGKLQLNLVKRWLDDSTRVQTELSVPRGRWVHVAATYDGSRTAAGIQLFVDGQLEKPDVLLDELNQPFNAKAPVRVGGGGGKDGRFRGRIRAARIDAALVRPWEIAMLATPETLTEILAIPPAKRSAGQQATLREYFLAHLASAETRKWRAWQQEAERALQTFRESLPTVMVMEEMPTPRESFVLRRGQYDQPGERVTYGVPKSLSAWPEDAPRSRLGLAQWLVSPQHPLTARVQINRLWQLHFGTGLVKTTEDFGSQGEWPSHPELLDWLAVEWPARGWDVKWLQRQLLTSRTYRQSSVITVELRDRDPENRLLARGPRQRLSAEQLRDQALFLSGQLIEQLGGSSVRPWQPPGLWKELTGAADYEPGEGAELVRRSLYTFWKRTIAPPNMIALDAPSREYCTVRASRTNTPLQALTLLNDPLFAAAAEQLATQLLSDKQITDRLRLSLAFETCTSRQPTSGELDVLERSLAKHRALSANEQAAWEAVMRVLLNLDETLHKN